MYHGLQKSKKSDVGQENLSHFVFIVLPGGLKSFQILWSSMST